jgi:GAF domain-containing protein
VAVLALAGHPQGRRYDESERLFAEHVGDQGALAIDRALLFQQNQDRLEDLDALLKVSRELTSTLDLDHVMVTAVNLTGAIVQRERAVLALLEGGKLKVRAVSDFARVDPNTVDKLGLARLLEWLGYRKLDTFEARLSQVEADPEHEGRDVLLEYFGGPMRALYAIGLRDDQGPVGVLLLEAYEEGAFASPSDREALGVLAGQLSVSIRNAELYRQLPMVGALTPLAERRRQWQRMTPARRTRALVLSGAALLLVAAVPFPRAVGGDAQVLPEAALAVRAPVDGLVRRVDVRAGDVVAAGQRLATLEPEGYAARLEALRAEADRAAYKSAAAAMGLDAFARSQADLDRQAALARLADAERDGLRAQLVAPQAGVVLTPNLEERAGARLAAGDIFCQVSRLDSLRVEMAVSETEIARVRPGARLRLKVLGFPDRQFRGAVTEVAWQGEPTRPGRPAVFRVLGTVGNPGATLKTGMTGRARVDVAPETLLVRWLRGIWRWLRMGFWM